MKFGILLFPAVEELDFVGPWEMVTMWKDVPGGPETCLLIAQDESPINCAKGMCVLPHTSFANCPALDVLLVPGGQGTRVEVNNPVLVDFVAKQSEGCQAVLSVCTGAFILHAAGVLKNKRATTHWASLERLHALGDVEVVQERFVQDGKVWSAAGVSAGIDLILAFIAATAGDDAAGKVQFSSEYYPSQRKYGNYSSHAKAPAYIRGK